MPWHIEKHGSGYYVVKSSTGKKMNKKPYPSKEAAKPYLKELYSHEGK